MKKRTFKIVFASLVLGSVFTITSCKKEDTTPANETPTVVGKNEVVKSGEITKNQTWYADSVYYLSGKVIVKGGAQLTIQPGTIIKGKEGNGTTASALIITRGCKIIAEGTADKPIIFTSELDNITKGQKIGTNLTKTDNQKWGGLIILGNAPISATNGNTESSIEGIPAGDGSALYGGNNATDNSGVLNFVSIRHGGAAIAEGNEINALTLGGVGSGTRIENIEIYATLDDGVEFFGGTVNTKNLLVYYQGDDGIDIDQNYSGTVEDFMVVQGNGIATDKGLEIDGPEGVTNTAGLFILKNGILKTEGTEGVPADFKDKAQGTVENLTFEYQLATSKDIKIRANFDAANSCATKTDAYTNLTSGTPKLTFTNNKLGVAKVKVYTASTCTASLTATEQTNAESKITNGTGSTIVASTFSWTCAGIRGEVK